MSEHNKITLGKVNYNKDRPKAKNPLKIMDLTFRDGHQSLFATRGRTEDMIPVAEMMDEVGFWALETWGGATFDTMHRFLNEDPWERIRTLKKYVKKTPFSMLLRAQNLVGYRNYADDLAVVFVERAVENGMDIFRTFDALNDFRNFETVVPVIKKLKKHFQGCICYTTTEPRLGGEVYNLEYYKNKGKALEDMGADSICIKDMAGLIAPYDAYNIVKALKNTVKIPIHLHSHFTSGMAQMSHLKAIEAGVDIIDTCMSPYAFRTSHPAIEPLVMTLLGTNRDTGFDINQLADINEILEKEVIPKYRHLFNETKFSIIDINVLLHQTPGGMLSNLVNQLKEMDALDKIDQVFKELPKVRKDLGQIPLVTPTSQIVGVQTVNNVLFDDDKERYKMITSQVKDLCYGLYGKTAVPISEELKKKALKGYSRGDEPITCRPAEVLEPELEKAKEDIKDITTELDDVIIYALFPVTGKRFLKWKYGKEEPPMEVKSKTKDAPSTSENARTFNVFVDGEFFEVKVDEPGGSPVAGLIQQQPVLAAPAAVQPGLPVAPKPVGPISAAPKPLAPRPAAPAAAKPAAAKPSGDGAALTAPMPGTIVKIEKNVGDSVKQGDTVVVLEAMKMENALAAPATGTIKEINCKIGDAVPKNAVLCVIG